MHRKLSTVVKALTGKFKTFNRNGFKFYNIILILFAIALGIGSVLAHNNTHARPLVYDQPQRVFDYRFPQKPPEETRPILYISRLNLYAPIILNVNGKNKIQYNKSLYDGVAHMKNTALPGQNGNTFIFGHSSFYDQANQYAKIFATLNQLEKGDTFKIRWQSKNLFYTVTSKKMVAASFMEATAQKPNQQIITLMTCWPVGTNQKRLIVIAKLNETK